MSEMTFDELCSQVLKVTYYAEQETAKALPKMVEAASSPELKHAFGQHLAQTHKQVERLEQVFASMGEKPATEKCPVIDAMIETAEKLIKKSEPGAVRDAGLIFCGQNVEHYEMAHYGTMIAWAKEAGKQNVVSLLEQTLQEEKASDAMLNKCAHGNVNRQAATQVKKAA